MHELGVFKKYYNILNHLDINFINSLINEANKIEGWLCNYQIPLMWTIFSTLDGSAVEVGCWKGKATFSFKNNIPYDQFNLFCIDPFTGSEEHQEILQGSSTRKDFEENLKSRGILDYIKIIEKYSADASKDFEDESLDLVFIDAGHDYENVKLDILSWYPKLKKNALIFGHDYPNPYDPNGGFEELSKAVNEHVKNNNNFSEFSHLFGIWGAKKIK